MHNTHYKPIVMGDCFQLGSSLALNFYRLQAKPIMWFTSVLSRYFAAWSVKGIIDAMLNNTYCTTQCVWYSIVYTGAGPAR